MAGPLVVAAATAAERRWRGFGLRKPPAHVLCCTLICVSSATACPTAHAQQLPSLKAGDRIRVVSQAVPNGEVEGSLVDIFRDTLSMVASDSIGFLAVHLNTVGRFEVSRGRSLTPMLGAAALGAGVGAWLGSVLPASNDRCRAGFTDVEDCATEVPDALVGAVGGALGAALLARTLTPERWERIRPDLLFGVDVPQVTTLVVFSLRVAF